MIKLQVYISDDCWSCEETRRIAADVTSAFPKVSVDLVDIQDNPLPEHVFAVPTYVLNGRVISLGNPTRQVLSQKLLEAQMAAGV